MATSDNSIILSFVSPTNSNNVRDFYPIIRGVNVIQLPEAIEEPLPLGEGWTFKAPFNEYRPPEMETTIFVMDKEGKIILMLALVASYTYYDQPRPVYWHLHMMGVDEYVLIDEIMNNQFVSSVSLPLYCHLNYPLGRNMDEVLLKDMNTEINRMIFTPHINDPSGVEIFDIKNWNHNCLYFGEDIPSTSLVERRQHWLLQTAVAQIPSMCLHYPNRSKWLFFVRNNEDQLKVEFISYYGRNHLGTHANINYKMFYVSPYPLAALQRLFDKLYVN